jgi:uncharacterized membrane protein
VGEPPKKRPWFQFHLSTAIVAVLVLGALMGANLTPTRESVRTEGSWSEFVALDRAVDRVVPPKLLRTRLYGWPEDPCCVRDYVSLNGRHWQSEGGLEFDWSTRGHPRWSLPALLAYDLAVWVLVLAVPVLACEFLSRRSSTTRARLRPRALTCAAAVVATSVLVIVNTLPVHIDLREPEEYDNLPWVEVRGWPWSFECRYPVWPNTSRNGSPVSSERVWFDFTCLLWDGALACVLVAGVVAPIECLIRRREGRRETVPSDPKIAH